QHRDVGRVGTGSCEPLNQWMDIWTLVQVTEQTFLGTDCYGPVVGPGLTQKSAHFAECLSLLLATKEEAQPLRLVEFAQHRKDFHALFRLCSCQFARLMTSIHRVEHHLLVLHDRYLKLGMLAEELEELLLALRPPFRLGCRSSQHFKAFEGDSFSIG